MMANDSDHCFSIRDLRHLEPKISNVGSKAPFLTTRIKPSVVYIHPTPIPWMPGSIRADAAALHHNAVVSMT